MNSSPGDDVRAGKLGQAEELLGATAEIPGSAAEGNAPTFVLGRESLVEVARLGPEAPSTAGGKLTCGHLTEEVVGRQAEPGEEVGSVPVGEVEGGLVVGDPDADGLTNADEYRLGTFLWADVNRPLRSWGSQHDGDLVDLNYVLDQEVTQAFGWERGAIISLVMYFLLFRAGFEFADAIVRCIARKRSIALGSGWGGVSHISSPPV